jgi:hypothetical protein
MRSSPLNANETQPPLRRSLLGNRNRQLVTQDLEMQSFPDALP